MANERRTDQSFAYVEYILRRRATDESFAYAEYILLRRTTDQSFAYAEYRDVVLLEMVRSNKQGNLSTNRGGRQ